jgi:hypothetical protein
MTAEEIFRKNGNFENSPLIRTVRNFHDLSQDLDIPYAVIGGMAVVRNGAVRTTVDVDILTTPEGWNRIVDHPPRGLEVFSDHAVDIETGVDIDVLFPGDDWEMKIPLPDPEEIRELDPSLGGYFCGLRYLLEIKTAVFVKKRDEDGIEIAAKDLADLVALTENNTDVITGEFIELIHPAVREEYRRIAARVLDTPY